MHLQSLLTISSLYSIASARHVGRTNTAGSPCAQISAILAPLGPNIAAITPAPTISAKLGYDCLNSVPLYKKEALELVDQILPYLGWHSDLADLKDPPASYSFPAHDVIASLKIIKTNLQNNKYPNEYAFQADLFQMAGKAYDGHLYFWPDLLTSVMGFSKKKELALVSVSKDGLKLPKLYLYGEKVNNSDPNAIASAVDKINGVSAARYIEDLNKVHCQYQDKDACYNANLFSKDKATVGSYGDFQGLGWDNRAVSGFVYAGPNTSISFENGTTAVFENDAVITKSFDGVTDGASFYEKFCRGISRNSSSSTDGGASTPKVTQVSGYPQPIVVSQDTFVAGYYLKDPSVSHVAVLAVMDLGSDSPAEFQAIIEDFIHNAKADGKTKIILDLTGNKGGYIVLAYDLFRQFFPQTKEMGYHRIRRTEAFDLLAPLASNKSYVPDIDPNTSTEDEIDNYTQSMNYRYDLNQTFQHFHNLPSMLNGTPHKGDNYTSIKRWDLNNPYLTTNKTMAIGIEITGYGTRANVTQHYQASDILIMTDGNCASSCALSATFFQEAGVQFLAMGGRPSKEGMQAIGGVKSMQAWTFGSIYSTIQRYYNFASPEVKSKLDAYVLNPIQRAYFAGVNLRDMVRIGQIEDGSWTSAQVLRDEAECRLFYTRDMLVDVEQSWIAAAKVRWGGAKCVVGGFKADVGGREVENAVVADMKRSNKRSGSFETLYPNQKSAEWRDLHILSLKKRDY